MENEKLNALSVAEFTGKLSSKEPAPGGGGAAALTGALAAALGGMVACLTTGKPKYAEVEEEIQSLKEEVDRLRNELLALVEKDAEVFVPLSKAYGMASVTEEEKTEKERVMQVCLKQAASVPLEIMEKCASTLPLIEKLAEKGSVMAVSDAGCAAALSKAAMQAAWLNVRINVRLLKDEKAASEIDSRGAELLKESIPLSDRIYLAVERKLL